MTTTTKIAIGASIGCAILGLMAVVHDSDPPNEAKKEKAQPKDAVWERVANQDSRRQPASRRAPRDKPPERRIPLEEISQSLRNSKLGTANFADLGARLADNFDLLELTDEERVKVLKVVAASKKELLDAEARLLKAEQTTPGGTVTIDFTAMEGEAQRIRDSLKESLAATLPPDVAPLVTDSVNWDEFYLKFPGEKEIQFSFHKIGSENTTIAQIGITGEPLKRMVHDGWGDEYPQGASIPAAKVFESGESVGGTNPLRFVPFLGGMSFNREMTFNGETSLGSDAFTSSQENN